MTLLEKIEARSEFVPECGCRIWTGAIDGSGYGRIIVGGRAHGAHRLAWELANNRPVPAGFFVLHQCDVPLCVNPAHLSVGPVLANNRDCIAKGRNARGERNGASKLTADQVREIRDRRARGETLQSIGDRFGILTMQVSRIARRQRWAHL